MVNTGLLCFECGTRINYKAPGVGQYVTGIRQNRVGGGANQIIDPQPTEKWLCRTCTDSHRALFRAPGNNEPGLFG